MPIVKRDITFSSTGDSSNVQPPTINAAKGKHPNQVFTTRFTPLITWLPKSLFVQFQRAANIYFFFICVLVCFPWSPTMWQSTVNPFVLVLLWTALKDLYEDRRRKRDDDAENFRKCTRYNFRTKAFETVRWMDVLCGDLIFVYPDEAFPADMLLIRAAGGQAFISTVNLDGETNLKERRAVELCSALTTHAGEDGPPGDTAAAEKVGISTAQLLFQQGLELHLEMPKPHLTDMDGNVQLSAMTGEVRKTLENLKVDTTCYLNYEHFVPRGCVLRNTPWILAIAAYVGDESKSRLNVASTAAKISNMQRYLNFCIIGLVATLIIFCLYAAIRGAGEDSIDDDFHITFLKYVIILYPIVPISLYVVYEMVKLILGFQINFDKQMYDKRTDKNAAARTADLVEEIGQVDFIFSDKTGTLTENEMVFARACIQGHDLGDFRRTGEAQASGIVETQKLLANFDDPRRAEVRWFFFCLVTCHTAQVDIGEDGVPKYSGSSPDEVAFLDAAHSIGISFQARRRQPGSSGWELHITGPPGESPHILTVLCEIPFNSDRKRMSIICEHKGEFFCITKGADNVISALCDEPFSPPVLDHLQQYSMQGLRTLAIASKIVDQSFLEGWQKRYAAAGSAPSEEREKLLAASAAEMENSLMLSGISAIEDKLQEGVPEAIVTVKAAGIRFWVLTGDKTETAVEIVRACRLFTDDMTLAYMTNAQSEEHTRQLVEEAKKKLTGVEGGGLILDGTFAKYALVDNECRISLYQLAIASKACVCCRLSPQQKRRLVELVKEQNALGITLAIGDGANDVSMIQGAHVGIGVRGKEGNQAVQASDIAISQFRFLVPLLLCHGRRAYRRVALFLCYYIYKHVVIAVADMIWAHQYRFGGAIGFPEWLSSFYSVFFTSLPIMVIAGFDQDVPDEVACNTPSLYEEGLKRMRFNGRIFIIWMLSAVWHGALAWIPPYYTVGDDNTETDAFWLGSCTSFSLVVTFVDLRLWMVAMNPFSKPTLGVLIFSYVLYWITLFVMGHGLGDDPDAAWNLQYQINGIPAKMFENTDALLCLLLLPFALLIDLAIYVIDKFMRPFPLDKARWDLGKKPDKAGSKQDAKQTQAPQNTPQPAW